MMDAKISKYFKPCPQSEMIAMMNEYIYVREIEMRNAREEYLASETLEETQRLWEIYDHKCEQVRGMNDLIWAAIDFLYAVDVEYSSI